MTTPLSSTTGTSAVASTAPPKKPGDSSMGPDAFMKLLVAQLKYQNPMAPTDGQAYMTQMATFAQVEKLDLLVKAQADAAQWQQRVSAEGLVGRRVTGTADGETSTGTVVGVRYTADGAVLDLDGGRTLAAAQVERVESASEPPPPSSTPSSSSSSSGSSGSSPSSTTADPAGTPSA